MSLKSFFGKILGKKSPESDSSGDAPTFIQHEISFAQTLVENPLKNKALGELQIFVNNDKTNIYDIFTDIRIGRDPSQVEIAIPELIVSKSHCSIFIKNGEVWIKDNHSTNGTYVNREKIEEQILSDGDTISLGKKGTVKLVFHKREPGETEESVPPVQATAASAPQPSQPNTPPPSNPLDETLLTNADDIDHEL